MKRKYEIAVISKGAFARTIRIFNAKHASSAVIALDAANYFTDKNADALFSLCKRKKLALIGIDGTERFFEYLPFKSENAVIGLKDAGGGAQATSEYVLETIIPYLDKRFGFKKYALFGRSLAAAAVLFTASKATDNIHSYGMTDAPLFISPAAYDEYFKHTVFPRAEYYIRCSASPEFVSNEVPITAYKASAVSIATALVNSGIDSISLQIKTDKEQSLSPVLKFINTL